MTTKKDIYFAGGCFWGTEHFMKLIDGVEETQVGYANGSEAYARPTYKQVCTGLTGYAETVRVHYDASKVKLSQLIDLYFKTIDPTSINRQGGDVGTQYRTGIYFADEKDQPVIEAKVYEIANAYAQPVVVEILPLINFYEAEDYHQDYLDKNPQGYCHIHPDLFELARQAVR